MLKKWNCLLVACLFTVLTLVLGACAENTQTAKEEDFENPSSSNDDSTKEPKKGGTYTVALISDGDTLDPHRSPSKLTHDYAGLVYNKLITYKTGPDDGYSNYNVVPDLAESWDISDDGKVYTFHLRDTNWHDIPPVNGRKLVAEDVVATMERIQSLPGVQASLLSEVESVVAKDEKTVVFTLKTPLATFMNFMAHHFMWILPKEATDEDFNLATTAIGTGPFMLKKREENVQTTFVRNPDYYEDGKPYLDEVKYLIIPDQGSQIAAFRTKQVDAISQISPEERESLLKTNPETVVAKVLQPTQTQVAMNMEREPFTDLRVRKAISMAIDRQNAVDRIYGDGEVSGPVNPTLKDWSLSLEEREMLQPYDPERAKKLLAEAGYPDGFKTTIVVPGAFGSQHIRMAEWVMEDLKSIGIQAELEVLELAAWIGDRWPNKDYDMAVTPQTWFQEADEWLWSQLRTGSPRNWFGISDPGLDEMLDEQRLIFDEQERKEKVYDIQRYALEEVVNPIPLVSSYYYYPTHSYVKNFELHASYGNLHMKNVWIDK